MASDRLCVFLGLMMFMSAVCSAQKPELVVQTGHTKAVRSVAFSPDGQTLATSGDDGTIKLWEVASGKELRTLKGHASNVTSIAFSPDGHTLASAGTFAPIKLWTVATGKELRALKGSGSVYSIAFSPDGQTLASGNADTTVELWEVANGTILRTLRGHVNSVRSVVFNPDGQTLASGSEDSTIKVWEVASGKELRTFNNVNFFNPVVIAFSPDGQTLASGSLDGSVKLWDTASGKELRTLQVYANWVRSFAFSPNGHALAGGSAEGTIKLWDVASGRELRTLQGNKIHTISNFSGVLSVAFSPDGQTLASGESDKTVKLWEVASGETLRTFKITGLVYSFAFSPDSQTLLERTQGSSNIRLWKLANGIGMRSLQGGWTAFSPDGKLLAGASQGAITLLEIASEKILLTLRGQGVVNGIAFSPDGKTLVSTTNDGTVKLWNVTSGEELRMLQGPASLLKSIAFSPDSQTLAIVESPIGMVTLWEVATGKELRTLQGNAKGFSAVVFSPDSKTLARVGWDGSIELWEIASGRELHTLQGNVGSRFYSVVFSPDSQMLVSIDVDGSIKLWQVASGKELRTLKGHAVWFGPPVFSPNGQLLAHGSRDGSIKVWDVASGRELLTLGSHSGFVRSVVFSPDGKTLASNSEGDPTLKLWDIASGTELCSLIVVEKNEWLVVTPDGLFDGSPAAWNQILWRFSASLLDVAPVEAFFSDFYHPGLLADIFAGKRPRAVKDIVKIDRRLPTVNLSLSQSKQSATSSSALGAIRVSLTVSESRADEKKSTTSGAQDLRIFRNGSLVKVWRGNLFALGRDDGCNQAGVGKVICEATIRIVAGENRFNAYAFNRDNIKSEDAALSVSGADNLKRRSTAYIFVIGVNVYSNSQYNLRYAGADAQAFADELQRQQIKLGQFSGVKVISLIDKEATKANIMKTLEEITSQVQPEDAVFVYFAGHGTAQGNRFYLVPHDLSYAGARMKLDQAGLDTILSHSISDRELEQVFEKIDARTVALILDTCNSGQALESKEKRSGPMNSKGLAQLAYEKGMYILTAAESFQAAREAARLGHGYLTYALVKEGLKSAAADSAPNDGQVTLREWLDYATQRVPRMQQEALKETRDLTHPLTFVEGEENIKDPTKRNLQTPRVFYRRETEGQPLIVAKP